MLLVKLANVLHIIFEKEHVSMYSTQEYKRMFATVNLVYKSGPSMQGSRCRENPYWKKNIREQTLNTL